MRCPDENVLAGYVDAALAPEQRAALERHIDGCEPCRSLVSDLARMQHAMPDDNTLDERRPTVTRPVGPLDTQLIDPTAVVALSRSGAKGGDGVTKTIELQLENTGVHVVAGTMVGEYEVTAPLGAGGMGAVYAAIHPRIGKKAAIKILSRDLARDPSALVRFENEARAVNAIGHPNLIDIFAFGELPDGNPYFVMELVEGESLDRWLQRRGRVSLETALPILRQIVDALAAAHERGIIHRDLKPGNVMIAGTDSAPRVKVLDFGLAKMAPGAGSAEGDELTHPGVALGTPYFMSPEQYLGGIVDRRTDIYALGVLVYQVLTGTFPFAGNTPSEIGIQHLNVPPTLPSSIVPRLSRNIDRVLIKALAKDANERYGTVREMLEALEQCVIVRAATPTETAVPLPPPAAVREPVRRTTKRWVVAGAVAALGVSIAVIAAVSQGPERTAAAPAQSAEPAMPARPVTAEPIEEPIVEPSVEPSQAPAPAPEQPRSSEPEPKPVAKIERKADAKRKTPRQPTKRAPPKPAEKTPGNAEKTPSKTAPEPRAPAKPPSTPDPDDDKMLLEAGAVKKAPR